MSNDAKAKANCEKLSNSLTNTCDCTKFKYLYLGDWILQIYIIWFLFALLHLIQPFPTNN